MGAELGEPAVVDDRDAVARAAVESRCATTTTVRPSVSALERPLDRALGAGVEVRRRLVEHEHRRVGERGAGERHELALARRQPRAALAHLGVEPVGERGEALGRGRARRPPSSTSSSVASARPTRTLSRTVPANRKPSWGTTTMRSRSDASVASRRSTPPKRTVPVARVVEARDQLGERRLAGAGRADEREPLARRDRERRRRAARRSPSPYANETSSTSIAPRSGRSTAPGRSAIDGSVSSSSNSLCSAAPADCTVLYSWLSCWIGSNRLFR